MGKGEKSLLCDPGSETRDKKGEDNKWVTVRRPVVCYSTMDGLVSSRGGRLPTVSCVWFYIGGGGAALCRSLCSFLYRRGGDGSIQSLVLGFIAEGDGSLLFPVCGFI